MCTLMLACVRVMLSCLFLVAGFSVWGFGLRSGLLRAKRFFCLAVYSVAASPAGGLLSLLLQRK
jgi:hypothetical protein